MVITDTSTLAITGNENTSLKIGDIIRSVGGQIIGPDFGKLHDSVMDSGKRGGRVSLEVYRQGKLKTLNLKPLKFMDDHPRATRLGETTIVEANSPLSYAQGYAPRIPIIFKKSSGYQINTINGINVNDFTDLISTLNRLIKGGHRRFIFNDGLKWDEQISPFNDVKLVVYQWDEMEGQWTTKDYDTFLEQSRKALTKKRARFLAQLRETPAKKRLRLATVELHQPAEKPTPRKRARR